MKNTLFYFVILTCLLTSFLSAQENLEAKVSDIENKIETINKEEKIGLKHELERVNLDLEKGLISKEEAVVRKKKLGERYAKFVDDRVSRVKANLTEIVEQSINLKTPNTSNDSIIQKLGRWNSNSGKRTKGGFLFAFGLNNLETNGNINNSDYYYWQSYFFEFGSIWDTRLIKDKNLLHLKYGLTFTQTNLCPTENRVFKQDGNQTNLEKYPLELNKSRFENMFLTIPINLEFDLTKTRDFNNNFQTKKSFRFGLGGYLGLRMHSKQKIVFEIEDSTFKQKEIGDFNVNDFIYGLSTYAGYKMTSLYIRYDLNPLFYSNTTKQNNISLGVRFDLL